MKTHPSTHTSLTLVVVTAVLALSGISGAAAQGNSSQSTSSPSPADARRAACWERWQAEKKQVDAAAKAALKAQAEGKELTLVDKAVIERSERFPSAFVACS